MMTLVLVLCVVVVALHVVADLLLARAQRALATRLQAVEAKVQPATVPETPSEKVARLRGLIQQARAVEVTLTGDELVERMHLAQARATSAARCAGGPPTGAGCARCRRASACCPATVIRHAQPPAPATRSARSCGHDGRRRK